MFFFSQVNLVYPSKHIRKKIEDETEARIVRNIVDGTHIGVGNAVWASETLKSYLLKKVENEIREECSSLCSRKSPSILANTSPDHIISLKDAAIVTELEERAPTLHRCLLAAFSSKRKGLSEAKCNCSHKYGKFCSLAVSQPCPLR